MKYVVVGLKPNGMEIELGRYWSAVQAWETYRHYTTEYKVYSRVYVIEPWWAWIIEG